MDAHFIYRRLHSLTGIVPVGLFLIYHLYIQLYLHSGAEVYNEVVNSFYDSPLALWVLALIVYTPLIFHSVYGAMITFEAQAQPNYHYFAHLLYWLQRLS
ncbi:MAG: succinate dehydrogenase, partial [SAR324 cluster bacterium]|nr:succinate dehydrogenase [SAR324 cluster bacterium]